MKHQILLIGVLTIGFLFPAASQGQSRQYRDRMDKVKNRSYYNTRDIIQRDRRELQNFHQTLSAYQEAVRHRNRRRVRVLREELERDMRREVRQSERKLMQGNDRYYSDNRAPRRPDGFSTRSYRGDSNRRRNILNLQQDIFYDFLHVQEPRRGYSRGLRNAERKRMELLSEFLTSMNSEIRLSRKEMDPNNNPSNRRGRNSRYRNR